MPRIAAPRRVGRPTTKPKPGEKATLHVRASPALKRRLQTAADRADRSLSAEMELRLEASFRDQDAIGGPQVEALIESMAMAALVKFGPGWIHDPNAYDAVTRNDGLWVEHLLRWRPIVTGVPLQDEGSHTAKPAADEQALLAQLIERAGDVVRLLQQMQAEHISDAASSRGEQPAPAGSPRSASDPQGGD